MHAATPVTQGERLRSARSGAFALTETRHPFGMCLARHAHAHACVNFVLDGVYDEGIASIEREHMPLATIFKPAGAEHENRFERAGAHCLLVELVDEALAPTGVALDAPRAGRDPRTALTCLELWSELCGEADALTLESLAAEAYSRMLGERVRESRSPRLRAATALLHDAPGAPWTLSGLAAQVGLHPSHLGRAFRARHGTSVGEYLRRLRVAEAARRLAQADTPVAELATELGFADQSHLTRAFRKRLGWTPAAFRRAHSAG